MAELLRMELSGSNSSNLINSNLTERNIAKLVAKEIRKLEEYFVTLCQDVLVEVLHYGTRRQLTKLERHGRRFHCVIENFFEQKPFLRLSIEINQKFLVFLLKFKLVLNPKA